MNCVWFSTNYATYTRISTPLTMETEIIPDSRGYFIIFNQHEAITYYVKYVVVPFLNVLNVSSNSLWSQNFIYWTLQTKFVLLVIVSRFCVCAFTINFLALKSVFRFDKRCMLLSVLKRFSVYSIFGMKSCRNFRSRQ